MANPMRSDKDVWAVGPRSIVVRVARVLSYLVYAYLVVVEIILFIGFFLLLFGANPSAGFTEWAYRNLDRVMEPFRGIFTPIELGTTSGNVESVFETSVLFAMIVYGIVAIAIHALIAWLSQRQLYLDLAKADAERRQQENALAAAASAPGAPPTTAVTVTPDPTIPRVPPSP